MNVAMKAEWRTSTVVELCQSMRETSDYSALPILADALQDADCGDADVLARLRRGVSAHTDDVRLVALIMSDKTAGSVRWLDQFATELGPGGYEGEDPQPMNYGLLMAAADLYVERGEYTTEYGTMKWQEALYGREKEFWKHYQVVTGKKVKNNAASFFSCSC